MIGESLYNRVGYEVRADVWRLSMEVLATESIYLWQLGHAHTVERCPLLGIIVDNRLTAFGPSLSGAVELVLEPRAMKIGRSI